MTWTANPALETITQSGRTREINPLDARDIPDGAIIDVTNLADGVLHSVYFDLQHKEHWSLQLIMSDGTATDDIQIWIHGSGENESDPSAVSDWSSIIQEIYGVASLDNSAGAINRMDFVDTHISCTWIRYQYQRIAGAANDGDIKVNLKRWF
jgi:hypothetical protein